MNRRVVIHAVASIMVVVGLMMLTAVPVSAWMGDTPEATLGLLGCALGSAACGILAFFGVRQKGAFGFREGFAIVTFGWLAAALFGSLPFVVVGDLRWIDAFFETMSGFTTTGASVLERGLPLRDGGTLRLGIADMPQGLIFWRSMTHWLGGMGIVVLSMAILPWLGLGAQQLYKAEMPGPISDRLTPRIADSAKILWGVYVLLSALETAALCAAGMSLFDAWCHTCATVATGGFSTQQASVAAYDSVLIDGIITVFMFLAGVNFILHFRALRGKPLAQLHDEEFRFYLGLCLVATLTIAVSLLGRDITTTAGTVRESVGFPTALRYAAFQTVSMVTTTGFVTADFNLWPAYAVLVLIGLMFFGGCAGSTAGGMKQARIIMLLKYAIAQIERCVYRRTVSNIRLNQRRVDTALLHKMLAFFFLFIGTFAALSIALCALGVEDIITASSASIAILGNVGPGLGRVGATCTYAWMSAPAKLLLAFGMLLGRLELYTVLALLIPSFHR